MDELEMTSSYVKYFLEFRAFNIGIEAFYAFTSTCFKLSFD